MMYLITIVVEHYWEKVGSEVIRLFVLEVILESFRHGCNPGVVP